MSIQLVSRTGCHLCEDAAQALTAVDVPFERLDVDEDPELNRLYDFRVPVLLVDGEVAAEGKIDVQTVRRALAR
jgi:glutaredoxin